MAIQLTKKIGFNIILFIVACIALSLSIYVLAKPKKCNYINLKQLGTNSKPPPDYKPIYHFENGTNFDLVLNKSGGKWGNDPLNPPNNTKIAYTSGWSYFIGSWGLIDIYEKYTTNHLGIITWKLMPDTGPPYSRYPYLIITENINDNGHNGCNWGGNPKGISTSGFFSFAPYSGADPNGHSYAKLICTNCDIVNCGKPVIWSVGDQKWYADYGAKEFQNGETLIQRPGGAGGRLFLGNGPGVTNSWKPDSCAWAITGQWQIDILLNHQDKGCWCETFYLAGRNKYADPKTQDCSNYADGQDKYTTEIDICETTWGNCKAHTSNILNFGGSGISHDGGCAKGPLIPGTWMTCGARLTPKTVEIYYILPGGKLTISNSLTTTGIHSQQMVPYLGTWCINECHPQPDVCTNKDIFTTQWKNYKYSEKTDGPLALLS
jgi:hypothetical protein